MIICDTCYHLPQDGGQDGKPMHTRVREATFIISLSGGGTVASEVIGSYCGTHVGEGLASVAARTPVDQTTHLDITHTGVKGR